ncbi:MAG TPA: prepilin-type N-terminal cleavage/methylation domain-containing protein [Candidatus Limnocylindrales bacterium]|nr:prepilin-type N-terminal cleavage/methylation domain-containing protein [Candidatus Limnocylindrales bacterium]
MFKKYYKNIKGFTLVELLLVFAISGIIISAGVTSSSILNNSQVFNGSVSEVQNTLNVARSRAISQVKPANCGAGTLDGYEVKITVSGTDYEQSVVCGGVRTVIERRKLASSLTFATGSTSVVMFNVSTGTMTTPGIIMVTGLGKTSTLSIDRTGTIILSSGAFVPSASTDPTATPAVSASCNASTAKYRLYPAPYNCVEGDPGTGTYCDATCGQPNVTPSCNKRYYYYNSVSPAICYDLGAGAFAGSDCEETCGGRVGTAPVATTAPTATTAPAGVNTTISFSVSPNPVSSSQSISLTATVTGINCTPTGYVDFYRDNQSTRFVAATTGSSNPGVATYSSYPASVIGVGTHPLYARYVSNGACPAAVSSTVNLVVQ